MNNYRKLVGCLNDLTDSILRRLSTADQLIQGYVHDGKYQDAATMQATKEGLKMALQFMVDTELADESVLDC